MPPPKPIGRTPEPIPDELPPGPVEAPKEDEANQADRESDASSKKLMIGLVGAGVILLALLLVAVICCCIGKKRTY